MGGLGAGLNKWTVRKGYGNTFLPSVFERDLLFLYIFHHAVNAFLCWDMGTVDQAIGRGVEVLTTVEHKKRN